jgi:hypothetical protein
MMSYSRPTPKSTMQGLFPPTKNASMSNLGIMVCQKMQLSALSKLALRMFIPNYYVSHLLKLPVIHCNFFGLRLQFYATVPITRAKQQQLKMILP